MSHLYNTVDHNAQDSQILLDKSILKNFKINICNDVDSWKFEQKLQITKIFSHEFVKKMISIACIFEIWTAYKLCLDNDNDETNFWNNNNDILNDFTNVFKRLCAKYYDFFNIQNTDWLASHWFHNHVIDLKLNTEFLYMCMYNMFLTELKTLNNYLNDVLVKE